MKTEAISRRNFIRRAAVGTATLALTPASSLLAHPSKTPWVKHADKYTIYLTGQTHIDPVWLWRWNEGVGVVHSTFRSALDRMNETPGLTFSCSSALFYRWVAETDPGMLEEIRRRVAEGRWYLVGGWWVEPDMNIPSGEAMVRQGLYGQRTFEQLFGRRVSIGFSPDSFGHAGTVPQILRLQGIDAYVFDRPSGGEKEMPDLFWWEAPDGTRVLAFRRFGPCRFGGLNDLETEEEVHRRVNALIESIRNYPTPSIPLWYGIGDHGGGPTKVTIRAFEEVRAKKGEKGAPRLVYGSEEDYFNELRAVKNLHIPVLKDDLQHHAVGCYTVECAIKKNNRLSETALVTAEKIAATGSVCWNAAYPKEQLTKAWEKVMFMQFHDSLGGSSLTAHSEDARHSYGYALNVADETMVMAVQKLEWQIPSETPGMEYIVLFNPHAWEIQAISEYQWPKDKGIDTDVLDENGQSLPHQWTLGQSHTSNNKWTGLALVTLPPMGYRQIRKINRPSAPPIKQPVKTESGRMENEYLRISFSKDGHIGIFDKESGREVFAGGTKGCRALIIDDPYDTWAHDIKGFPQVIDQFGDAQIRTLEEGPLRACTRVTSRYGKSSLSIDWMLIAGSRKLEAHVTLDWHEQSKMLKFSFPVDVESPESTYETPYGYIVRPTNGDEEPGQRWIDLTGKREGGLYGLSVINDAKYGYSVEANDLRVSIARSTVFAVHDPYKLDPEEGRYVWMDQGIQTFRMMLAPHQGDWRDCNIPRLAEEFMAPPVIAYQGVHKGSMPKSASFLSIEDAPNVIVTSIKQAEEGEDIIFRLVETYGRATSATLRFPSAGKQWKGSFRPCEIKSLRLDTHTGEIKEVNLLEV
ncbi:MAG: glycosyl hydrolase-related protein [Tannerellaceae bacterium]|jgi:alpha-mannosidase|nr:glycosyl hydrolase-related protein [Tannerellaceae bacterium]